jgi:hypothetical protein
MLTPFGAQLHMLADERHEVRGVQDAISVRITNRSSHALPFGASCAGFVHRSTQANSTPCNAMQFQYVRFFTHENRFIRSVPLRDVLAWC